LGEARVRRSVTRYGTPADIDAAAVVGAGEMGRGIAAVQALAGREVRLFDVDDEQLSEAIDHVEWSTGKAVEKGRVAEDERQAALDRLSAADSLADAVSAADFVTEAVVERQAVKESVFEDLDDHAPEGAILATNTSGLNVTELAEVTGRPELVCGTHWFNPPMLMELVEVVSTEHLASDVADLVVEYVEDIGKTSIRCRKDVPSFIVNRCFRPYGESAAWLAYYGEAEKEAVDSAMKYREDFPMGPFELADFTGGIQLRVEGEEDHLEDDRLLAYDTRVCPLLHELYEEGHYGRKAGKGYYDYTDREEPHIPATPGRDFDPMLVWAPVINEAAKMVQHDVATVEDVDTGMKLGGNWPVGPFEKADEVGARTVVRYCVEWAERHDPFDKAMETLPCDLLVGTAKAGERFR
jgi:enoyl-CoA hydratase/3-hydroxyacyl-CoA dehydrogenase